jgi:MEMO1 family protein
LAGLGARRLVPVLLGVGALILGCCARGEPRQATASSSAARPVSSEVRPPAVAGQFYPAGSVELRAAVADLLARARAGAGLEALPADRSIVGVLAPHAGYVYSGLTAAHAFAGLAGRRYDAVVLLGSPHRVPVSGACVYPGRALSTPLGLVPVEQELAGAIATSGPGLSADSVPHAAEHSLEVELPFLQTVLGDVPVVPILVMGDRATLDRVAASLTKALLDYRRRGKSALLVVSTDLAHYPSRADAEASDREMLPALAGLDGGRLLAADERVLARKLPGLECTVCGLDAAYVGEAVARGLGATEGRILDASTSADSGVAGAEDSRVVGYGAIAFLGAPGSAAAPDAPDAGGRFEPLGQGEQELLLALARKTLEVALDGGRVEAAAPAASGPHLRDRRGVFVTLTIDGDLRGCIGTHEPDTPLWDTVRRMAAASAFEDPRFPPLARSELARVRIEISVYLTRLLPLRSADEYVVGRQGIILKAGGRAATFLPQVPVEQGWDRETTLAELCLKAGLPKDAWRGSDALFLVYETQVFGEPEGRR